MRAIEIATAIGHVPDLDIRCPNEYHGKYDVLQIGIKKDDVLLKKRISTRLTARMRRGMVAEAKHLHADGISWRRMEELGLEYKYLAWHLQEKLSKKEMVEQLNTAIWQYAKRQKTWFKRNKRIKWFSPNEMNKIEKEVENFLCG
jgi:tRNA dimethylallyltransferase